MPTDVLADTRLAFDSVAETYDEANARNPVLCEMRARTVEAITKHVEPGSTLLDLGCGPGPDAELLARKGYRLVAIDWSLEMVRKARQRMRDAGLADRVRVLHLGIHELHALDGPLFDGAYSNFGPLNCVPDLDAAAALIAARLRPGGVLVASVIGRRCPWELALYAMRGNMRRARVRFAREAVPVPLNGGTVWTHYYTPQEFERVFRAHGFSPLALRSMGLFLPPPYLQGFAERHPRAIDLLTRVEERLASAPLLRQWGDHFLSVMRT